MGPKCSLIIEELKLSSRTWACFLVGRKVKSNVIMLGAMGLCI